LFGASIFLLSLFFTDYSFLSNIKILFSACFYPYLAILLLVVKFGDKEWPFVRFAYSVKETKDKTILIWLVSLLFSTFLCTALLRHLNFASESDLAFYDQIIWNTAQGRILHSSLAGGGISLSNHFEPILVFLAPLFWVLPRVEVLFLVQAFSLASAIVPLYFIAKKKLDWDESPEDRSTSRYLIWACVLSYFFSKGIHGAAMFDFHTDCFLPPLMFWAYYFIVTDKLARAVGICLAMLLCKENAAILVFALGLFAVVSRGRRFFGISVVALGISAWIIETRIVIPLFSLAREYSYLSWLPFGHTYLENIRTIVSKPYLLIQLFFTGKRLEYYLKMFAPTGFLALLSPSHYALFMFPMMAIVLGSVAHHMLLSIDTQYSAHTVPAILIAAICAIAWLRDGLIRRFPHHSRRICSFLALYILLTSVLFYWRSDGCWMSNYIGLGKDVGAAEISRVLREHVPDDASVSTISNLAAHLSHRQVFHVAGYDASKMFNLSDDFIVIHERLMRLPAADFQRLSAEIQLAGYGVEYQSAAGLIVLKHKRAAEKGA